ncbi:MAG: hypothetical protein KAS72_09930 [Phycisphaerales bacterium]|nr:hypothetical protein [Phycisphaerales bacterium]
MTDSKFKPDTTVRSVLADHPEVFSVFTSHGMCEDCAADPPSLPLAYFADRHNVPVAALIADLDRCLADAQGGG